MVWVKENSPEYLHNVIKKPNKASSERIYITNGFSPKVVTIKVETAVRWLNKSGLQQKVNSDNYPSNQLHKELNFGIFNNDSSVVYTFTNQAIMVTTINLPRTRRKIIVEM